MSHKLAVNPLSLRPYASLGLHFVAAQSDQFIIPVIAAGRSKPGRLTLECDQRLCKTSLGLGLALGDHNLGVTSSIGHGG